LFGNPTKWWYNNAGSGFDWSISYATSESPSNDVKDFVFLAEDNIILDRHGVSEGNIHSNNGIKFKKGAPSTLNGNVTAVDEITIETKNTIDGDVTAGGNLTVANSATITGTAEEDANVVAMPLPSPSFTAGGVNHTVSKNGSLTLSPHRYGSVRVGKNGTLNLSTGDYFFENLELKESTKLVVDVTGQVNIHVIEKLVFGKKAEVIINPGGDAASDQLTFEKLESSQLMIGAEARVLGSIIAADATVKLYKNSRFKGSICAATVIVQQGAVFLHHDSQTGLPKDSPLDREEDLDLTYIPAEFELKQNYPNPFNPSTTITFALPKSGDVKLSIYNLKGQLVRTLVSGPVAAGWHKVVWDGRDQEENPVASGIYLYRLATKDFTAHKKLVLVR
jgi:cytoskeletal protein CcmA (bactofilin family)